MESVVFHASPIGGLKLIEPRSSTHLKNWVYAAKDPDMAALFLGKGGSNFTHYIDRDQKTQKPVIIERFKGANEVVFEQKRGSIYHLPSDTFQEELTTWSEDLVSEHPVIPLEELIIEDAHSYLLELAEKENIIIMNFPDRYPWIPEDDSDLVQIAVDWYGKFGESVLVQLKEYHPHLVPAVLASLKME